MIMNSHLTEHPEGLDGVDVGVKDVGGVDARVQQPCLDGLTEGDHEY